MSNDPVEVKSPTVLDHVPLIIGKAAVEVFLAAFPIHLLCYNLVKNTAEAAVSIRNEKQTKDLLDNLKSKLVELEQQQKITKESLPRNHAYQEIANKRLSLLSALDSEEDLNTSASFIALVATLTGEDPKDKSLLKALGEITPEEFYLFKLIDKIHKKFVLKKSQFNDLERRDFQIEQDLRSELGEEFFAQAESLLKLHSFMHILSRVHSIGLIEVVSNGGFSSVYRNPTRSIYPPALTPIGEYLIAELERTNLDT